MIKSIVVVGGGTAGWITAGLIAAKHVNENSPFSVTLVESPDIGIIGVGEGTWPTMVNTLQQLGIKESEFLQKCDASFKQASKFCQWVEKDPEEFYYHPFTPPQGFEQVSCAEYWQKHANEQSYAQAVSIQAELCEQFKAPKQLAHGDYATVENHGYHLDAGKFTQLLMQHCSDKLGVKHIQDRVIGVNSLTNGDIASLSTEGHGELAADLFIDCSGSAGLLIDKHYKEPFISKKDVLFVDRAIAVQVPYQSSKDDVQSATLSTAQEAGWIWDIGLPTRRGVGHVFSSKYISTETAKQQLRDYLKPTVANVEALRFKELTINPGYRQRFWVNNCVAVGMASGFLEPLEASALVMIETAAKTIALHMPASREGMDVVAKQYNRNMAFRWERIIDFLKLHYLLSKRTDSEFWMDNRDPKTVPESLKDLLQLWRYQPPTENGFLSPYDLFPAASYQYILYGMGFETYTNYLGDPKQTRQLAQIQLEKIEERKRKVIDKLPSNRQILNEIQQSHPHQELNLETETSRNWHYIDMTQIPKVAQHLPIFLKPLAENDWRFVALTGLAKDEELIQPNIYLTASGNTEINHLGPVLGIEEKIKLSDVVEPVNLDITFNDLTSILIKGLYVLSVEKIENLEPSVREQLVNQPWYGYLPALQSSLQHVAKLIEIKNQQLAA